MYSSRFEWSLETNPLSRLLDAKRRSGTRILDLTESNPTRAELAYPPSMLDALADPRALLYEPAPWGLPQAREAVARLHAVDAARVMITASTSESYSFLFKLLCGPGDEILVPAPSYPLFEFLAKLDCVVPRTYPLRYQAGRWRVDFERLAVTARTRAIVVVNPNNPTGSYLQRAEAGRLLGLGLPVISDEVFSCYPLGDDPERMVTLADAPNTFCLNGLSKMVGLPQLKAGWILTSVAEELRERLELIADTFLSVSAPVQHALPKLLESGAGVRVQIQQRTRANLEWLKAHATPLAVEGGWYAVLPLTPGIDEQDFVLHLLETEDVLVQPGFFYDFEQEGFVVLSLLSPEDAFREGVRRLLARMG